MAPAIGITIALRLRAPAVSARGRSPGGRCHCKVYICKLIVCIIGGPVVAIVTLDLRNVNRYLCIKLKNVTFAKMRPKDLFTFTYQIYKMHILIFRFECGIILINGNEVQRSFTNGT